MSQLRDDLNAVADLLEQGWCRGSEARDSRGHPASPLSVQACSWCLQGACDRIVNTSRSKRSAHERFESLRRALDKEAVRSWDFKRAKPGDRLIRPLIRWNDKSGRTQAEVVALVRRAAGAGRMTPIYLFGMTGWPVLMLVAALALVVAGAGR